MHTPQGLLDLHARTHSSLERLLRHCGKLAAKELARDLPGFGFPSVHSQLFHIFDCEDWWMGGVTRQSIADSRPADYPDVKSLNQLRKRTAAMTIEYLKSASTTELNTVRTIHIGGKRGPALAPANVLLHVITHAFHHKGQTVSMCRMLGHPPPDTDLPIRPR
jgi:uncharacterized damage-inducible protein DinB